MGKTICRRFNPEKDATEAWLHPDQRAEERKGHLPEIQQSPLPLREEAHAMSLLLFSHSE
jgi:hypothetical protein